MTSDDCRDSGGLRMEIQLIHIMQHVDVVTAEFHELCGREVPARAAFVDISADRSDRRHMTLGIQDIGRANISCMEDMVRTLQSLNCLGAEQPMCVGDHSDAHRLQPNCHAGAWIEVVA